MYIKSITVANDTIAQAITFRYSSDALCMLSGFTDLQSVNNWTNQGYNQHGATYVKSLMNMRDFVINFVLNTSGTNYNDAYTKAMTLFNPTLGLSTMTITTKRPDESQEKSRQIQVFVTEAPSLVNQNGFLQEYSVELNAPFPFFKDLESNSVTFNDAEGGFTFATQFDEADGKIFGLDGHVATVTNQGDIVAPLRIYIKNSAMTNPIVYLEDGSYIGLTKSISTGETIEITTEYGNKNITINGVDNNRYLTEGSKWIQLPLGESKLSAYTSTGSPTITVYWDNYYVSYI